MIKWSIRLFGLGMIIFGLAAYFGATPWPIACQSRWCHAITAIIPFELVIAGLGLLLMLIARLMVKNK